MNHIPLILQIAALIFLAMGGLSVTHPRFSWGWVGMFFWLLSLMLGALVLHPVR